MMGAWMTEYDGTPSNFLAIVLVTFSGMLEEVIRKGFKVTSNLADKKNTLKHESPNRDDSQFDSSLNYIYLIFTVFT